MEISWQRKLFSFLLSFLFHNKKSTEISQPNKILIIHWAYLGDIITAVPAIRLLRTSFPHIKIVLLTTPENKPYILDFPLVDEIIYLPYILRIKKTDLLKYNFFNSIRRLRKNQFDIAIELTGRIPNQLLLLLINARFKIGEDITNNFNFLNRKICSSKIHEIDRNIGIIKLLTQDSCYSKELWNPVKNEDVKYINSYINNKMITFPFLIVHFCASWKPKMWNLKKWKEVCDNLLAKNKMIVFIGSQHESKVIESFRNTLRGKNHLNLAGKLTIRQVLALMQFAEIFIGNDSGPMHLSAVAGLKGVVLFGPGNPLKWSYPIHKVIYKQISCSPCAQIHSKEKCHKGFKECKALQEIHPEEVIEECIKLIGI
jgi:ADP-heptose:LPS heptosyltransferase